MNVFEYCCNGFDCLVILLFQRWVIFYNGMSLELKSLFPKKCCVHLVVHLLEILENTHFILFIFSWDKSWIFVGIIYQCLSYRLYLFRWFWTWSNKLFLIYWSISWIESCLCIPLELRWVCPILLILLKYLLYSNWSPLMSKPCNSWCKWLWLNYRNSIQNPIVGSVNTRITLDA